LQVLQVELSQRWAPVKPLPGTRMSCCAPVPLIAFIMAWLLDRTSSVVVSCGSFIRPKITLGFSTKRLDSSVQKSASCCVVAAFGSVVLPIIEPEKGCIDGSLYPGCLG